MQELKCPDCGYLNPDIRELGYTLPWTCGKCPHIWRLQDLGPIEPPTAAEALKVVVDLVMKERVELLMRKHSRGLTADEDARLDFLNAETRRLCPLVTPDMTAAGDAVRARIDARRARSKTPNVANNRIPTAPQD